MSKKEIEVREIKFRAYVKKYKAIYDVLEISFDEKYIIVNVIDEHDKQAQYGTYGFNESVGAVEFVIGAGVSGNIAEKIGYFVKLSSIGRSFAPNSYDTTVGAGIGATTVGITLEF